MISPEINLQFKTLLLRQFSRASFTAVLEISSPVISFANEDKKIDIAPVPQYRSTTVSQPVSAAYSLTTLYNIAAPLVFVWKKELAEILNSYFPIHSLI